MCVYLFASDVVAVLTGVGKPDVHKLTRGGEFAGVDVSNGLCKVISLVFGQGGAVLDFVEWHFHFYLWSMPFRVVVL